MGLCAEYLESDELDNLLKCCCDLAPACPSHLIFSPLLCPCWIWGRSSHRPTHCSLRAFAPSFSSPGSLPHIPAWASPPLYLGIYSKGCSQRDSPSFSSSPYLLLFKALPTPVIFHLCASICISSVFPLESKLQGGRDFVYCYSPVPRTGAWPVYYKCPINTH